MGGEQRLERVPLYTLSLQTAAHWLACNDETLYFDGLYTNKLPTDGWPAFSAAVLSAHREVQDHLGLQAPYTCLHLRNGDFAEACRKWQGQKWFESLDGKGFLCDIPADELPLFANTTGGLVLSRAPIDQSLVERYGWKTSLDVATATRLQAGVDDPAVAAFVEQLLCADADDIVLNMFSTFSRHIARIRTERHGTEGYRTHYFKRSKLDAATDAAILERMPKYGRVAGEASREEEEISMTRRFSQRRTDLARDLAREEDDEIASAQGLDFTLTRESDEEIANAQGYQFVGELS